MKGDIDGVGIEELVVLKSKMYSVLVSDFSGYIKGKSINNVVKIISNEYKDDLLNKKCLQH